jgi:hypothetical protein
MIAVCPATPIVPVRALPVLAAMLNTTAPLPSPLAPDVIVIHDATVVAVQEQLLVVVTVTVPTPGPAATV